MVSTAQEEFQTRTNPLLELAETNITPEASLDVELAGHLDVHAGGDIRLRVEIDHEGADTSGEGGGGKPQRDSGLADTTLERAHRQYVHEALRYRPLGWVHTQAGPVTNSEV